jgi:hypothetical protein
MEETIHKIMIHNKAQAAKHIQKNWNKGSESILKTSSYKLIVPMNPLKIILGRNFFSDIHN